MSKPVDEFSSCHIDSDESNHEDAVSDNEKPKQQQQIQFEAFTVSSSEGLEKGYESFQHLLSQLEAHASPVSTEDANHKFLRSLPYEWTNVTMSMRLKEGVDDWSIDDLFNNLRVFEQDIKEAQNHLQVQLMLPLLDKARPVLKKVSSGSFNSGNYASSSNNIKERDIPAGFADEVFYSLFAKSKSDL
ncbi:hypothetical protein CTI12_AA165680 [Artemisia annua]|uniref:Uncharacterized protein n=1 Tax=Artemisia annua TaxID=35608 RepID=A0A2U1PDJ5_ARTAN|nr:hypothetical protein CTI12_AA165680 [Artemisia annua]